MISEEKQKEISLRLKKIQGQIAGINRMVEEKRRCIEILDQIAAVAAALHNVGTLLLENHLELCVAEAVTKEDTKESIRELSAVLKRLL